MLSLQKNSQSILAKPLTSRHTPVATLSTVLMFSAAPEMAQDWDLQTQLELGAECGRR